MLSQDFLFLPHHRILEQLKPHAHFQQGAGDPFITLLRIWLIPFVGENGLNPRFPAELGQNLLRLAAANNQGVAQLCQIFAERLNGLQQKRQPARADIRSGAKGILKNENGENRLGTSDRLA